ncbi:hypothetical protein HG530_000811 [Fusarium avenaceum]|nr:hypothetical protein HG530_000811 [Fusarium avenaceum]
MSSDTQAPSEYAPEAPVSVPQGFMQEPAPDYQSLLKNMPGNNEVLLGCLLALVAVVALLALAIIFVFIMSRREGAAREKEQSLYSEVFAAIRDATKEAADQRNKKEDEAEKTEVEEAAPSAPDNSSPGSEHVSQLEEEASAEYTGFIPQYCSCAMGSLGSFYAPSSYRSHDSDEEEVSQRTALLKKVDGKVDKKVRFDVENTTVWKFDDEQIFARSAQLEPLRISNGFAKLNSSIKSFHAVSCSVFPAGSPVQRYLRFKLALSNKTAMALFALDSDSINIRTRARRYRSSNKRLRNCHKQLLNYTAVPLGSEFCASASAGVGVVDDDFFRRDVLGELVDEHK